MTNSSLSRRPKVERVAGDHGWSQFLSANLLSIVFVLAAIVLFFLATRSIYLFAIGCDPFGYARQAVLFRHNGLLAGLNTAIDTIETRKLIAAAKSIDPDVSHWYQAIAPHCHFYRAAVDHIVLQYPPGTGLVLSLFPDGKNLDFIYNLGLAGVVSAFVVMVAQARISVVGFVVALVIMAIITRGMLHPETGASASIPVSFPLIAISAAAVFLGFPRGRSARVIPASLLGLAGGLLIITRLPNFLLLVGLAVPLVARLPGAFAASTRTAVLALLAAATGFAIFGPGLLLSANYINTGSAFATTYSTTDASLPTLSMELIGRNIIFYFGNGYSGPLLLSAIGVLILRLLMSFFMPSWRGAAAASIGAFLSLALSLAFFLTHDLHTTYYMVPASTLTLCLVAFEILENTSKRSSHGEGAAGAHPAIPIIGVVVLFAIAYLRAAHYPVPSFALKSDLPGEVRAANAIVWGDATNGTIFHYEGKYAAKLNFARQCFQDAIVHKLSADGSPQYFLLDSADMEKIVARLEKIVDFKPVGIYSTYKPVKIMKLDPYAKWRLYPSAECAQ